MYIYRPVSDMAQNQLQVRLRFLCTIYVSIHKILQYLSRGYDSVIRRMNILVCSGIDFMCAYSTFALALEDK